MKIYSYLTKYMRSYSYMMVEGTEAFLIDPCQMPEIEERIAKEGLHIGYAYLTHEHYDHISGTDWARAMGAVTVASTVCNKNLSDTKRNHSKYYSAFCASQKRLEGDEIPPVKAYMTHADTCFEDEMTMTWQGHELSFFSTPGHSEGSTCLLVDGKILFTGDTLFDSIAANPDLLGGSAEALRDSEQRLLALPEDILVYPGHYEPFYIGERRRKKL